MDYSKRGILILTSLLEDLDRVSLVPHLQYLGYPILATWDMVMPRVLYDLWSKLVSTCPNSVPGQRPPLTLGGSQPSGSSGVDIFFVG